MKRIAIALIAGLAVSTLSYASASALIVDGGTIQYGQGNTTCDVNGVKAGNWGLETDTNTVTSVKITGIAAACAGAELFVRVGPDQKNAVHTTIPAPATAGADITVPFTLTPRTAQSINEVNVWIEG